jgi:signal transduction histidine kinase
MHRNIALMPQRKPEQQQEPAHFDVRAIRVARDRLAEQLHDGPLQELVAARAELRRITRTDTGLARQLLRVDDALSAALDELKRMLWPECESQDLRRDGSAAIPDLYGNLLKMGNEFEQQTGVSCSFEILPEHTHFDPALSDVVHRCVRELLQNVRKHAEASEVRLGSGSAQRETVFISVEDNGKGFDGHSGAHWNAGNTGFGLWSIEHQIGQFGGRTEISSSEDGGKVRIVLPADRLRN